MDVGVSGKGGGVMRVRDKLLPKSEYLGRPTEACDRQCPCRPCFHPHDCGHIDFNGKWIVNMRCVTRDNSGCPNIKPAPEHRYKAVDAYAADAGIGRRREQTAEMG